MLGTAGGYTGNWWQIDWDAGLDGWSAASVISLAPPGGDVPEPNWSSSAYSSPANIFWRDGYAPQSTNPPNPKLGNSLGNCTWYAHGRLRDLGYDTTKLAALHADAGQWDDEARAATIWVDDTPTVGSIAQTDSSLDGLGHVAVVESINTDGTITITESSFASDPTTPWNFLWRHRAAPVQWFQHFIHVPKSGASFVASLTSAIPSVTTLSSGATFSVTETIYSTASKDVLLGASLQPVSGGTMFLDDA